MQNFFGAFIHRRLIILWAISLLLLLSACDRGQVTEGNTAAQLTPQAVAVEESAVTSLPRLAPADTLTPTNTPSQTAVPTETPSPLPSNTPTPSMTPTPTHPLMIEVMRQQAYPGSELTFEQTLEPGVNYDRYIVSYQSEGHKIFALLTVPWGETPEDGWPIIIFNHGYIPPEVYKTTERYVAYVDGFARNGYIVFRSDYRGHGESEGRPEGGYGSPAYTIDVLNGLAAVQTHPEADPDRVGMWGHSMGGHITLRAMVVSEEIDAGVIWGGMVGSYPDLFERWRRRAGEGPTVTPDPTRIRGRWRFSLADIYGSFEENPEFWDSISATSYLVDLSGPLQLHHSTTDASVPVEFSEKLYEQIQLVDRPGELYLYEGDNHDIDANFWAAMQRSIAFFDAHVK